MKTFLLIAEGTSDRVLIHIITWILGHEWIGKLADFSRLPSPPKQLSEKLDLLPKFYEKPQVIFFHKDADNVGFQARKQQMDNVIEGCTSGSIPIIPIIPERMTEAWYLFNEMAIRSAAQNPKGRSTLNIPGNWDSIANPKETLYQAFRIASECSGRDLRKLVPNVLLHQLAEDIIDYSPLRRLEAFQSFESDCIGFLQKFDER